MKNWIKRAALGLGVFILVGASAAGLFVWTEVSAFERSMSKQYDIAPLEIQLDTSPAALARGQHLADSLASCALSECHGKDLAGGEPIVMGPVGTMTGPNITSKGLGAVYSDSELARLIRHGIKKDGSSVIFMPVHEINWLPDEDIASVIAWMRTVPGVKKENGETHIGVLGKVLDRKDAVTLDVARRIEHDEIEMAPRPAPTAEYGRFIARLCMGCHGETLSGGAIPGAPPEMPIPTNITPHESGIGAYTFDDFTRLVETGVKKNGEQLDAFMPLSVLKNMNEIERRALFAYLKSAPAKEFGGR